MLPGNLHRWSEAFESCEWGGKLSRTSNLRYFAEVKKAHGLWNSRCSKHQHHYGHESHVKIHLTNKSSTFILGKSTILPFFTSYQPWPLPRQRPQWTASHLGCKKLHLPPKKSYGIDRKASNWSWINQKYIKYCDNNKNPYRNMYKFDQICKSLCFLSNMSLTSYPVKFSAESNHEGTFSPRISWDVCEVSTVRISLAHWHLCSSARGWSDCAGTYYCPKGMFYHGRNSAPFPSQSLGTFLDF